MLNKEIPLPDYGRCEAFWSRQETDRPLLATWVGSYQFPDLFPIGLSQLEEGFLDPTDIKFDYFREDYENLYSLHSQATADIPWSAFPLVVFPWAEAIAGCPVIHREGNIWAEHWLDRYETLEDQGGLKPNPAWLEKLVEFTQGLVKLSDNRFPIAVSLLRGPTDLLAAIRGAQESILDLIDDPEPVERLLQSLTDLWIQAASIQQAHIPTFTDGYGWSVQNLWSKEPGGWFQDDAIAFSSPRLYQKYVTPCEEKLSRSMQRTGCHLHSAAIFTVSELLKMPELDVIEMNLDVVGKSIPEMIPAFQRVLDTKRLYVWGNFTTEDLRVMKENLPTRGFALQLMDDNPLAVQAMFDQVKEVWKT
jgi:hypothetical protein